MMTRRHTLLLTFVLSALCSFCLGGRAAADAEQDLKKPYQLRVALAFSEHRVLTPLFQEEVKAELGDQLRLAFGKLAKVEVVREHLLLDEVDKKGLQQALDGWTELDGAVTAVVLIDFAAGQYQVRARQFDGATGLATAAPRHAPTGDRKLVARQAALLVEQDFGLGGTVVESAGGTATLKLQGGALVSDAVLARWVKKDTVFALAQVGKQGAARLDWAVLRAAGPPQMGVVRCQYAHRHPEDANVAGFRALRLATVAGPVRLRLVHEDGDNFVAESLVVEVRTDGFTGKTPPEKLTSVNGLIISQKSYDGVAFVSVQRPGQAAVLLPVTLTDNRTQAARISLDPRGDAQAKAERQRADWLKRLDQSFTLANQRAARLNAEAVKSPEATLELARAALKSLETEWDNLKEEFKQVQAAAKAAPKPLVLTEEAKGLAELAQRHMELEGYVKGLDEDIRKATSPQAKLHKVLLRQAAELEAKADVAEAIALYQKVVKESELPTDEVKAQLAKLAAAWKPRGAEHEKARDFFYEEWAKAVPAEGGAQFKAVLKAFEAVKQADDAYTPRKVLLLNQEHARTVKTQLDQLKRAADTEDNRAKGKALVEFAQELGRFQATVGAFLKARAKS